MSAVSLFAVVLAPAEAKKHKKKHRKPPALSISDATANEPDGSSTVPAGFTVTLSKKSQKAVTASYATSPGTATATDFLAKSGTLTIPPNTRLATLSVSVKGDDFSEPPESFTLRLSGANGAKIQDGTGQAAIVDNDSGPDADADGFPDSKDCDPIVANPPGETECFAATSIYAVNQGAIPTGARVILNNPILSAVTPDHQRAWAAVKSGDVNYTSTNYSAIELDLTAAASAASLTVGDRVNVLGTVADAGSGAVKIAVKSAPVLNTGEAPPVAVTLTYANLLGGGLFYNGVVVNVSGETIASQSGGNWLMTDGLAVEKTIVGTLPTFADGRSFTAIRGIAQTAGAIAVLPRGAGDFDPNPVLTGLSLLDSCVNQGDTNEPALQVVFDVPAQTDTFVAVSTGSPSVATVSGGGVTVLQGQATGNVPVNGIGSGSALVTATLGTASFNQTVQVANPCVP